MKKLLGIVVLGLLLSGNAYAECIKGDCINGQSTFVWPDGSKYIGEIKNGRLNGNGTLIYSQGDKYVGEFKNDLKHGQGTYSFADGIEKYVGEYKDDKKHGQGTKTFTDGGTYVGEYKDDKKHGQGIAKYGDGTIENGIFKNGKLIEAVLTGVEKDLSDYLIKNKLYLKKTHELLGDKWQKLNLEDQKTWVFTFNSNKKGNVFTLGDEMKFVWNVVTKNSFNFKHPQSSSPTEIRLDFENNLAQAVINGGPKNLRFKIITVLDADIKETIDEKIKEEELLEEYRLVLDKEYVDKEGFKILKQLLQEMRECAFAAKMLEDKKKIYTGVSRDIDKWITRGENAISSNNTSEMRVAHGNLRRLAHQAFSSVATSYGVDNPTAQFCKSIDTNYKFKHSIKFAEWKNKKMKQ
tara:strand:- start:566 stop:1786 length:1221 start_codon:yes stop_codon:yes gene_type:complete